MDWVIFWMFFTDFRRMEIVLSVAIPLAFGCTWLLAATRTPVLPKAGTDIIFTGKINFIRAVVMTSDQNKEIGRGGTHLLSRKWFWAVL